MQVLLRKEWKSYINYNLRMYITNYEYNYCQVSKKESAKIINT